MTQERWDIHREGRRWTKEESARRMREAPEKIEFVGGIFAGEQQRFLVLGMLLENLGMKPELEKSRLNAGTKQLAEALTKSDWSLVGRLKPSRAQSRSTSA